MSTVSRISLSDLKWKYLSFLEILCSSDSRNVKTEKLQLFANWVCFECFTLNATLNGNCLQPMGWWVNVSLRVFLTHTSQNSMHHHFLPKNSVSFQTLHESSNDTRRGIARTFSDSTGLKVLSRITQPVSITDYHTIWFIYIFFKRLSLINYIIQWCLRSTNGHTSTIKSLLQKQANNNTSHEPTPSTSTSTQFTPKTTRNPTKDLKILNKNTRNETQISALIASSKSSPL